MLRICFAPWVAIERVRNLEAYVFLSLGFSRKAEHMFWQLLPAPVIGGQVSRRPPIRTDGWIDKKLFFGGKTGSAWQQHALLGVVEETTREKFLVQFWTSCQGRIWPTRSRQRRHSLMPWLWTEPVAGDLEMKRIVRLDQYLRRGCGSTPRQLFAMPKKHMETFTINKRTQPW